MTDEVSADLETALELARDWKVDGVELRGIGEQRYPDVSELQRERVPELLREWGLPVSAISPGLFKIPAPAGERLETRILRWEDAAVFGRRRAAELAVRDHIERLLPLSILAARAIGAPTIICFSFDRGEGQLPGRAPDWVIDVLKDAAAAVEQAGLMLALEVEHICWGDVGSRSADIVTRVANRAFGINWDPANAYRAGEDAPYPDGYAAVRGLVRHVHYKQASTLPDGRRGFTPDGVIDWNGQVEALRNDGYAGWITAEPHVSPKVSLGRKAVESLQALVKRT